MKVHHYSYLYFWYKCAWVSKFVKLLTNQIRKGILHLGIRDLGALELACGLRELTWKPWLRVILR